VASTTTYVVLRCGLIIIVAYAFIVEQNKAIVDSRLRFARSVWNSTLRLTTLNLSPVNAKSTFLSYVHVSPQTVLRLKIVINVQRMAYKGHCRLRPYAKVP